mmetsp:Transcript_28476/g.53548  ORF Transcript_28476/g.53548 Transcript_28476/m.53548 type:complete len:191 (+) Transcript_28476:192-764(+)
MFVSFTPRRLFVAVSSALLFSTLANAQIPPELEDNIPDVCIEGGFLDDAIACVTQLQNIGCLGGILDLIGQENLLPDVETGTCEDYQDAACQFYAACEACTSEFEAFVACIVENIETETSNIVGTNTSPSSSVSPSSSPSPTGTSSPTMAPSVTPGPSASFYPSVAPSLAADIASAVQDCDLSNDVCSTR